MDRDANRRTSAARAERGAITELASADGRTARPASGQKRPDQPDLFGRTTDIQARHTIKWPAHQPDIIVNGQENFTGAPEDGLMAFLQRQIAQTPDRGRGIGVLTSGITQSDHEIAASAKRNSRCPGFPYHHAVPQRQEPLRWRGPDCNTSQRPFRSRTARSHAPDAPDWR